MAHTNPNLMAATGIYGYVATQAVTTTPTAIIDNTVDNSIYKVNTLTVSNVDGTNPASVTVDVYVGSTARRIAYLVVVPAGSSVNIIEKNSFLYLQRSYSLRLTASADGDLEAVAAYEVIA